MAQRNDKYNFVLYIPVRHHERFRLSDEGRVVLEMEINPARKLMGKLVNRTPVSDVEFDELSSAAWLAIDGNRSVLDIARMQSEKTDDDIDESVRRIVQFMRYLSKRGWIRFKDVKPSSEE